MTASWAKNRPDSVARLRGQVRVLERNLGPPPALQAGRHRHREAGGAAGRGMRTGRLCCRLAGTEPTQERPGWGAQAAQLSF